jgi:hypothetical protein
MNPVSSSILLGAGATALVDLWSLARRRLMGTPLPDYGLVGRWIAWLPRGRFRHSRIAATPAVHGERLIGWTAHYAIGIGFAALLLALLGGAWTRQPTLGSALMFGIATVAAPFLIMQPGMGAGIAASKTPRPGAARLQSLVTHLSFGIGLYATARLLSAAYA